MQITLDIYEDIARQFAINQEGLSRAVFEALAIEGTRSGKLTTEQVRRLLGLATRYDEADGFLKLHQIYYHLTQKTSNAMRRRLGKPVFPCHPRGLRVQLLPDRAARANWEGMSR